LIKIFAGFGIFTTCEQHFQQLPKSPIFLSTARIFGDFSLLFPHGFPQPVDGIFYVVVSLWKTLFKITLRLFFDVEKPWKSVFSDFFTTTPITQRPTNVPSVRERHPSSKKTPSNKAFERFLRKLFSKSFLKRSARQRLASLAPYCPLTSLISSLISTLKTVSWLRRFSTVSMEDMTVEWSREKILPMLGKDMSVILRIR